MYELVYSKKAEIFLKKLDKEPQKQIINALEKIRIRPEHYLIKQVNEPSYKLRIEHYRLFIDLDKGQLQVIVIEIGHRKNIYKN